MMWNQSCIYNLSFFNRTNPKASSKYLRSICCVTHFRLSHLSFSIWQSYKTRISLSAQRFVLTSSCHLFDLLLGSRFREKRSKSVKFILQKQIFQTYLYLSNFLKKLFCLHFEILKSWILQMWFSFWMLQTSKN